MKITASQYGRLTLLLVIPLLIAGSVWRDQIDVFKRQEVEGIRCKWDTAACNWDVLVMGSYDILRQADLLNRASRIFFDAYSERIEITIDEEQKKILAGTQIAHIANANAIPFTKTGQFGLETHDTSCEVVTSNVKTEYGFAADGVLLRCSPWPFEVTKGVDVVVNFKDRKNLMRLEKMLSDASLMQADRNSHNKWAEFGNTMVPLAAYFLLSLAVLLLKGVIHFVIHGVSIGSPYYTAEELAAIEEENERYRQKRAKK